MACSAYWVSADSYCFCSLLRGLSEGGGRKSPGLRVTFFRVARQESHQRKGDPTVRVPPLRYGQPAMLGQRVRRRTHCALRAPFKQLRRVSARSACVLRHTHAPAALCFSARTEGNPGPGHPHGPSLRSARGTRAVATDARYPDKAERSDGANGCLAVWLFGCLAVWHPPHLAAPAPRRFRGGGCAEGHTRFVN